MAHTYRPMTGKASKAKNNCSLSNLNSLSQQFHPSHSKTTHRPVANINLGHGHTRMIMSSGKSFEDQHTEDGHNELKASEDNMPNTLRHSSPHKMVPFVATIRTAGQHAGESPSPERKAGM